MIAAAEPPQDIPEEPVPAAAELSLEQSLRSSIDRWISSWQDKRLDEYFAAYAPDFDPRYQDGLSQWRANRERVIGNAEWIRLRLTDFVIVAEQDSRVEVNFWLAYESPTYGDNTLKKLVLTPAGDDWLILEEVNLQVTR